MNLKPLRKVARLTQQQLADKSGLHRVTIARIEKGARMPTLGTLTALAATLDCGIEALLGDPPSQKQVVGQANDKEKTTHANLPNP